MSYFTEAVEDFVNNNSALSVLPDLSVFLEYLNYEIQSIINDHIGELWTLSLSDTIIAKINVFLKNYLDNNQMFEYMLDIKNFFNTKQLFIDFRDLHCVEMQTVSITISS